MLPTSLLHVLPPLLSFSALSGVALAQHSGSSVQFKAHGTGVRHAKSSASQRNKHITGNIDLKATFDDNIYTVGITLGGEAFTVQLDTGSSDLWVNTNVRHPKLTNKTDLKSSESYGMGFAGGKLQFAKLELGDYTIDNQIFLSAKELRDFGDDGTDGILGMAFDNAATHDTLRNAWGAKAAAKLGRAPITNIFAQNTSAPNFFDFMLGRSSDLDDTNNGTFLISAHAPGFDAVADAPKLPRVVDDRWTVALEKMVVNGKSVPFPKTNTDGIKSGNLGVLLDTGFSLPQLPAKMVDALYSAIPGAVYYEPEKFWAVPCLGAANLTFTLGGAQYPVHPLDLTYLMSMEIPLERNGKVRMQNSTVCISAFEPIDLDPEAFAGFDAVLGDSFLRNVYASFDYGDWDPETRKKGGPFVQLMSMTDQAAAWKEFRIARKEALAELPPTISPQDFIDADDYYTQNGDSDTKGSAQKDANNLIVGGSSLDPLTTTSGRSVDPVVLIALLAANLVVALGILATVLTMCVRGARGKASKGRYETVTLPKHTTLYDNEHAPMTRYND